MLRYFRAVEDSTIADISIAEFRRRLKANGFAYVPQTRGFIDLQRGGRHFERLRGTYDERGRLKCGETLAALLAARAKRKTFSSLSSSVVSTARSRSLKLCRSE
jgi:hypothetical protein